MFRVASLALALCPLYAVAPTAPCFISEVIDMTAPLTAKQIYDTARAAGFPPHVAVTMTAIALRESAGVPDVMNTNAATGDYSVGLCQINLRDPNVKAAIIPAIAENEDALKNPITNMLAAHELWGGDNRNLSVAWYIDRGPAKPGAYDYRGEYEKHLPAAQAAALLP